MEPEDVLLAAAFNGDLKALRKCVDDGFSLEIIDKVAPRWGVVWPLCSAAHV